jgi:hypothetical protein
MAIAAIFSVIRNASVPLEQLDFTAGTTVRRLPLEGGETYSGDASASFQPAEPVAFLRAAPR